jgi:hypothetical protein
LFCPHCALVITVGHHARLIQFNWEGELAFDLRLCSLCNALVNRWINAYIHPGCLEYLKSLGEDI